MALRLYPFRQYNETDVINLFANQVVDDNPSTDGNGSAGVMVKVLSGNMNQDTFDLIGSDYLGKTDYPFLGADKYPTVPLRFVAATTGAAVLGVTLNQTIKNAQVLVMPNMKCDRPESKMSVFLQGKTLNDALNRN